MIQGPFIVVRQPRNQKFQNLFGQRVFRLLTASCFVSKPYTVNIKGCDSSNYLDS